MTESQPSGHRFTNGIALVIASTQIQDLLGIVVPGPVPGEFVARMQVLVMNAGSTSPETRSSASAPWCSSSRGTGWYRGCRATSSRWWAERHWHRRRASRSTRLERGSDLTVAVEAGMILAALLFIRRVSATTTVSRVTRDYVERGRAHILQDKRIPDYVTILRIHGRFCSGPPTSSPISSPTSAS